MKPEEKRLYAELWDGSDDVRYAAFVAMMRRIETPVDWAYEVWGDLLAKLTHADNHYRARATQMLCGLAISDPEWRILKALDAIMRVTHDAKFVTARHTLQNVWKIGLAGPKHRARVIAALSERFHNAAVDKNCTLIRYDIAASMRTLFDATGDDRVRDAALALIESETDAKYRKKYAGAWRVR